MPKLNISHLKSYAFLFRLLFSTTYGAIYPIVPHLLKSLSSLADEIINDKPKSISLGLMIC